MTHYPFTKLSDLSFEFFTVGGQLYKAYFISYSYLFSDYPEFANDVFSFNLEMINGHAENQADERIGQTVVEIFSNFFKSRQNVVVYICDSSDDRHLARKRKFDLWFWKYNDGSIFKEDGIAVIADMEIYNSLLIHKQNKLADKIVNAFRTINERADDK